MTDKIHRPGSTVLGVGSYVLATMFDKSISASPGVICGGGKTQKGETIYLVQMLDTKLAARGKQDGCAQIEHGKEWVLSLYGEELTPTTKEAAEAALHQSQAQAGTPSEKLASTGR